VQDGTSNQKVPVVSHAGINFMRACYFFTASTMMMGGLGVFSQHDIPLGGEPC
jgi:hypothetical protein